jgi:uncharacterized membrane protein
MSAAAVTAPPVPRSKLKLVFFLVFGALTLFVIYMKNPGFFDPTSPVAQHFAPGLGFLLVHGFFGALALALGALQFSNRLRARYLPWHRKLGYVYVVSVFIAAPMAIVFATKVGTASLLAASIVQALGWMICTAIALYCVRNGNLVQHRRWMIRSYPFAMVFTVARLIVPIPPILAMGDAGTEIVVWSVIAAAAFLPSIFLDWRALRARPATKQTMAMAIDYKG